MINNYIKYFQGRNAPSQRDHEFFAKYARELAQDDGLNTILIKMLEKKNVNEKWFDVYFSNITPKMMIDSNLKNGERSEVTAKFFNKYVNAICAKKRIDLLERFHVWSGGILPTPEKDTYKTHSYLSRCIEYGFVEGVKFFHQLEPYTMKAQYYRAGEYHNCLSLTFMRSGYSNKDCIIYVAQHSVGEVKIDSFGKNNYLFDPEIFKALCKKDNIRSQYKDFFLNVYEADQHAGSVQIIEQLNMLPEELTIITKNNKGLKEPLSIMAEQKVLQRHIEHSAATRKFKI